jgi:hypothetical protein
MFSRDAKLISGENELAAHATDAATYHATGDLVSRTNVFIRIARPEGPTAVVIFSVLPVKSVELVSYQLPHL